MLFRENVRSAAWHMPEQHPSRLIHLRSFTETENHLQLFCHASGCAILEDQDQLCRPLLPKPVPASRCAHNEPHRSSGIGKAGAIHPVADACAGASAAAARYQARETIVVPAHCVEQKRSLNPELQ